MDIFVGSNNGHKIAAVREAATDVFPETGLNVSGLKVHSGVHEQAVGHDETLQGAINRLAELKRLVSGTRHDLLVAFQNGIFSMRAGDKDRWFDMAWVVAEDAEGNQSLAHSTGIEFDAVDVEEARRRGFKTTTTGSVIAERTGMDATDPHTYLTNEVLSRSDILREALKAALGQLLKRSQQLQAHLPSYT